VKCERPVLEYILGKVNLKIRCLKMSGQYGSPIFFSHLNGCFKSLILSGKIKDLCK
jgi:hypothetical protein